MHFREAHGQLSKLRVFPEQSAHARARTGGATRPSALRALESEDALRTDRQLSSGQPSLNENLVAAIQRLSLARTPAEVHEVVRSAARRLTGADGATVVLRIGEQCHYADEDTISPLWKGQRFAMDACISGWVMRHHRPAAIEDVYSDPRIAHAAYRPTFVKSLAMVPIRETDPLGAIGNYWAHRHQPTAQEIALLQALANSTAVAMETVRIREDLGPTGLEVIERLALAAEYRDDGTHEHTARVARTSLLLAQAMGLPADEASLIAHAAPLHDVGKLAIPHSLLLKPGRLSQGEFGRVKEHTTAGAAILTEVAPRSCDWPRRSP